MGGQDSDLEGASNRAPEVSNNGPPPPPWCTGRYIARYPNPMTRQAVTSGTPAARPSQLLGNATATPAAPPGGRPRDR